MKLTTLHELIFLYNNTGEDHIFHATSGILLQNLRKIPQSAITDLAELCYTSPATITRLVKALGCSGFVEFKYSISDVLKEYRHLNRCMPYELSLGQEQPQAYLHFLHDSIDSIQQGYDPAVMEMFLEAIDAADKVFLYVEDASEQARVQFQFDLVMAGKQTFFVAPDQLDPMDRMDGQSVFLIMMSNPVSSFQIYEIMGHAKECGTKILAIAPRSIPDVARYADGLIRITDTGTAADHFIFSIYLSLLTMAYRDRNMDDLK